ncbi:hypothetical protein JTB14_019109 [Gonioctena quinquepunctata]|nr:hypothetical protein JTB14_019109 [Gonioctena quinquepunctata]
MYPDEDSGDEDDGAPVDNLNRQQLRSHVEIVLPDNEGIDGNEEIAMDGNLLNGKEIGFYFHNSFTGFNILHYIKNREFDGTGTIRDNRVPQSCGLPSKKEFGNKRRGEYESALDKKEGIMMVKWSDNAPVSAVSTCDGVSPVPQVKRYSLSEEKILQHEKKEVVVILDLGFLDNKRLIQLERQKKNVRDWNIEERLCKHI